MTSCWVSVTQLVKLLLLEVSVKGLYNAVNEHDTGDIMWSLKCTKPSKLKIYL
jgi:hypothetical protein